MKILKIFIIIVFALFLNQNWAESTLINPGLDNPQKELYFNISANIIEYDLGIIYDRKVNNDVLLLIIDNDYKIIFSNGDFELVANKENQLANSKYFKINKSNYDYNFLTNEDSIINFDNKDYEQELPIKKILYSYEMNRRRLKK